MTFYHKKKLTILLVDDNISSIMPQMNEIKSYLHDVGIELILLTDTKSGKKIDFYLKDYDVDIVVTDNKMSHDCDGLKVVENVRKKNKLLDILFYSANSLNEKDYEKLSSFTSVEIAPTKKFVDHLESLIDKILSKYSVTFSVETIKVLEKLHDCNLCAENPNDMNDEKTYSIISELLSINANFSLADLWYWLSQKIPQANNEILEKVSTIFGKASFNQFVKFRYYCTHCNTKYARWPVLRSNSRQEVLKCHKCGKFDSVRLI